VSRLYVGLCVSVLWWYIYADSYTCIGDIVCLSDGYTCIGDIVCLSDGYTVYRWHYLSVCLSGYVDMLYSFSKSKRWSWHCRQVSSGCTSLGMICSQRSEWGARNEGDMTQTTHNVLLDCTYRWVAGNEGDMTQTTHNVLLDCTYRWGARNEGDMTRTTHNVLLDCTCVLFENMLMHCLSWCCAYHCPVRYFAMSDSLFFSAAQHTEFISLLCFNACSSRAERWNLDGWKCRRCTVQWVVVVNVNDSFVCACTLSRDDFSLFTFQFSRFGVIHF